MLKRKTNEPAQRKPLRLWPGVAIVAVQWLVMFVVPLIMPETGGGVILVGVACGAVAILWWLFFSRAPWVERVGAILLMPVAVVAAKQIIHPSIANAGMGYMFFIYSIPVLCLALVVWAAATRSLSNSLRRASMVAAMLLGGASLALIRTNGVTGDANSDFQWRWSQTSEQKLLAQKPFDSAQGRPLDSAAGNPLGSAQDTPLDSAADKLSSVPATTDTAEKQAVAPIGKEPPAVPAAPVAKKKTSDAKLTAQTEIIPTATAVEKTQADWPGFRGPSRDGIIRGVRIETNWSASPPVEMWRRPIGPGWSSFAVRGYRFYTQEQRGDHEIVACYNVATGEPIWMHSDSTRFWESNAGAGPRGTPTLSHGRVYTFGGTGILNVLNATDGSVVWSRHAAADAEVKIPIWGFAGSPLVLDSLVIIAAAGRLVGYDLATGAPRWFGPKGGGGYSSPQLLTIAGITQILLLNGAGMISVAPADGALLWEHKWPGDGILQPAVTVEGDLLIGSGSGLAENTGMLRAAIAHGSGGWTVEERWTTNGLKPYYNDIVIHKGHAFGFDGSILACINLEDGKRKWKGGRYGHGQIILLADQDLLLVLSEQGELALVAASSDQFTELARLPAIKGKTWNHPVLAGDVLLVRNGQEMVAFRLTSARS